MRANTNPDDPDEPKRPYWEKKKGTLPSGHEVGDTLKAQHKKQTAVWWSGSTSVVPAPGSH